MTWFNRHNITIILIGSILLIGLTTAVLLNAWAYPFALLLIVLGIGLFLQYPKRTFLALLCLRIIVDLLHFLPSVGGLSILEVFSGGSTVLCLVLLAQRFPKDIEHHPGIHLFLLWNLILIFHIFTSPSTVSTATDFLKSFSPVILLPVCSSLLSQRNDGLRVMKFLAYAGAIPILSSLYFLMTGQMKDPEMVLHGIPRLLGGYMNLRHHGLIMLIISLLGTFQFFISEKRIHRVSWGLYTLGAVTCLYLTMIRSSLLPLVIAVALFCWMTNRKWVVYILPVFIFGALLFSDTLQERFKDFILIFTLNRETDMDQLAKLGSGRYALWTASFSAWMDKPMISQLIGLGYGAHTELTNSAFFAYDAASNKDLDPHNDILYLLYDLGPLSLVTYGGLTWISLKACYKLYKQNNSWEERQLAAMCACTMIALTINNSISNGTVKRVTIGWLFWIFAGIAFGALKYHREERLKQQHTNNMEEQHGHRRSSTQ